MYVIILNILVYAHDALMVMLYYSRLLGRRYSMRTTALGAAGWCLLLCAVKLPLLYLADSFSASILMIMQCLLMFAYLHFFYCSSFAKKMLAFLLLVATLGTAEFVTVLIAGNLMGTENKAIEAGSEFTAFTLLLMRPMAILAYYSAFQIWNLLQKSTWIRGNRQWLCVILPLSQTFLLWYLNEIYTMEMKIPPFCVFIGIFLGLGADIYMYVIFDRMQKQEEVEDEVRLQKHLLEMEQLRYEKFRESLDETSRLRHDFQNYLLTLRSLSKREESEKGDEKT